MKRDWPRNQMPAGAAWNIVDMLPNQGAPLRQIGYPQVVVYDRTQLGTAATRRITAGAYAPFVISGAASPQIIAISGGGVVYEQAGGSYSSGLTSAGTGVTVIQNPVFHGGVAKNGGTELTGLVIIPDGTGAAVPKKYDGTTLGDLQGTPPKAKLATIYKDYTVLANGTVGAVLYPNRVWFSPEGDPDCQAAASWDTTNSWIDMSLPVNGIGATRNAILTYHDGQVSRIRGSIPPPDQDMVVDDPVFSVGLFSPRSIANYKDSLIWAAPEGVFRSDAVVLDDLTKRGGMSRYWNDFTKDATSTWMFSGGVYRDTYFLFVHDTSDYSHKDAFAIDLQTMAWTRLSFSFYGVWSGQYATAHELYLGARTNRWDVYQISPVYQVGNSSYKSASLTPILETPFYSLGAPGLKRIQRAYVGHQITDYGTDDPTCSVAYTLTPESTSYTTAGTLAENTAYDRKSVDINRVGHGVAFKFTRTNAGDFLLHDLGIDMYPQETSRLKQ